MLSKVFNPSRWATGYKSPSFFVEGMEVLLPWGGGYGLRCRVETAAGNSALIVNEKHKVRQWVDLLDVAVKEDKP